MKIRFVLTPSQTSYHPGQPLTGNVVITLESKLTFSTCRLILGWTFTSRHLPEEFNLHVRHTLPVSEAMEAGTHVFPFTLDLPHGPYSYEGELFSIRWRLLLEIDRAFAFDKTAEKFFSLTRNDAEPYAGLPALLPSLPLAAETLEAPPDAPMITHLSQLVVPTAPSEPLEDESMKEVYLLLGAGISLLYLLERFILQTGVLPYLLLVFGVFGGGVMLYSYLANLGHDRAAKRLNPPQLVVNTDRLAPGMPLHYGVGFTALEAILLRGITVSLLGEERVIVPKGRGARSTRTRSMSRSIPSHSRTSTPVNRSPSKARSSSRSISPPPSSGATRTSPGICALRSSSPMATPCP